jgi:hypothetical protein
VKVRHRGARNTTSCLQTRWRRCGRGQAPSSQQQQRQTEVRCPARLTMSGSLSSTRRSAAATAASSAGVVGTSGSAARGRSAAGQRARLRAINSARGPPKHQQQLSGKRGCEPGRRSCFAVRRRGALECRSHALLWEGVGTPQFQVATPLLVVLPVALVLLPPSLKHPRLGLGG